MRIKRNWFRTTFAKLLGLIGLLLVVSTVGFYHFEPGALEGQGFFPALWWSVATLDQRAYPVFGEMALLDPDLRSATVTALLPWRTRSFWPPTGRASSGSWRRSPPSASACSRPSPAAWPPPCAATTPRWSS